MADPLLIIGSLAAGLQLVLMTIQALLATIKLIKNLKEIPDRLAVLLNEVDDSISRLYYSCNAGSRIFQSLDPPQMNRLSRYAVALRLALEDIYNMLTPLFGNNQGRVRPVRYLWRSLVSLKIEKELPEKLQRLNRLNIEVVRELGIVRLETQLATSGLVIASGAASSQGFSNIKAKINSLQTDFRNFTILGSVTREEGSRKSGCGSSSSSSSGSRPLEIARVSQERAEQILRYLSGTTKISTTAGLRIMTPGDLPSTNLDYILFSIRTFYTIGNFDLSPIVIRPKFWKDTDLGIYLIKVSEGLQRGASQSQTRGFRILKALTAAAANTMSKGTASILIELLSTLSPVNTTTCPHPIALVINKLKNDNGEKNVTLRALDFIIERLRSTLGPIHPLMQLGTYWLYELLHRSGNFTEALRVAGDGIQVIRALLGPGSLQEHWLLRPPLSIYFDIVGQRLDGPNPDPLYHNKYAVIIIEDIAKTYEYTGNGQSEALAYIHDKLRELLKQIGKEDEFKLWTAS
ncbi:uncharacterized protein K444DRAFT_653159 [Hyaloscypha bicolor E]|uniref:Fungal N-terminal domain-containing protein n=1 Tax=Hyaloscypha bicolor E TaxID=1095630 RepID=A0A2J6T7E5_9HELO|nr:uncharacterized protein K444DRAFT_653159 [Hyaloscypha bicolor E]PMD58873.1 hypothetical protein K444DRAFT_653159 [Hyaloscypha bicolor E]